MKNVQEHDFWLKVDQNMTLSNMPKKNTLYSRVWDSKEYLSCLHINSFGTWNSVDLFPVEGKNIPFSFKLPKNTTFLKKDLKTYYFWLAKRGLRTPMWPANKTNRRKNLAKSPKCRDSYAIIFRQLG